jgi:hypothetical protein
MTTEITETQHQQNRAKVLFWSLIFVFGLCVYFLLAVQYEYWDWVKNVDAVQKASLEPLTWVLAALIGSSLYLLSEIATYYPKIKEVSEDGSMADFKKYTFWYISTLVKAPILAVVVMWLLVNLKIEIGQGTNAVGVSVNFKDFSAIIKIGASFILGFYGRVARKQLDIIAKYLFTRAWALAEQGFELVVPSPAIILLKDKFTFKTNPLADVVWTTNIGTIDAEKGDYTAPEDLSQHNSELIVRASLRNEPSATSFEKVTLKAFDIKTDNTTLEVDQELTMSLESKLESAELQKAKWSWKEGEQDKSHEGNTMTWNTILDDSAKEQEYTFEVTVHYKWKDKDNKDQEKDVTDKKVITVTPKKE